MLRSRGLNPSSTSSTGSTGSTGSRGSLAAASTLALLGCAGGDVNTIEIGATEPDVATTGALGTGSTAAGLGGDGSTSSPWDSAGSGNGADGGGNGADGDGGGDDGGQQTCLGDDAPLAECTALPLFGQECGTYEPFAVDKCNDMQVRARKGVSAFLFECLAKLTDPCDNLSATNCMQDAHEQACTTDQAVEACAQLVSECPDLHDGPLGAYGSNCQRALNPYRPQSVDAIVECFNNHKNHPEYNCEQVFGLCQVNPGVLDL